MSSSADSVPLSLPFPRNRFLNLLLSAIPHSSFHYLLCHPIVVVLFPPDRAVMSASQHVSTPRGKGGAYEDYLRAPPSNSCNSLIIWESASPIGCKSTTGPTQDLLPTVALNKQKEYAFSPLNVSTGKESAFCLSKMPSVHIWRLTKIVKECVQFNVCVHR